MSSKSLSKNTELLGTLTVVNKLQTFMKVSSTLSSNLDLDILLQKVVNIIVDDMNYYGGIIFLRDGDFLRSKTISQTWYIKIALKATKIEISKLKVEIKEDSSNYVVRTVLENKLFESSRLSDFVVPALSKSTADLLQFITKHGRGITLPLVNKGEVIGAIMFTKKIDESFSNDIPILESFVNQVSVAIQNARLYTEVNEQVTKLGYQNARLTTLSDISSDIISLLNTKEICQRSVDLISKKIGIAAALIYLTSPDKKLRLGAVSNNELANKAVALLDKTTLDLEYSLDDPRFANTLFVKAANEGTLQLCSDMHDAYGPIVPKALSPVLKRALGTQCIAIYPLKEGDTLLGIIHFYLQNETPETLHDNDRNFINVLSKIIAVALNNAKLYEEKALALEELNETAKKLADKNRELNEKYQQERDMMGIIGHELRTPMTIAKGNIELQLNKLGRLPQTPEIREILDKGNIVSDSINRESLLIETMVSTTHVENGDLNLLITPVDLNEVVKYAVIANLTQAKQKGLELKYIEPEQDVPLIYSDQKRVEEIVSNIVNNAVKYTKSGFVKVCLRIENDYAIIEVEDSGIGIPLHELENLGKKFYRINQHLDKDGQVVRAGGTGLGLYIAKAYLEALFGKLEIESQEGNGSIFRLRLPLENKFPESTGINEHEAEHELDMFVKLGFKR